MEQWIRRNCPEKVDSDDFQKLSEEFGAYEAQRLDKTFVAIFFIYLKPAPVLALLMMPLVTSFRTSESHALLSLLPIATLLREERMRCRSNQTGINGDVFVDG
jgi:hypothetical protein